MPSQTIRREALLPYTPEALYALINDIEAYPEFVAGCQQALIHHQTENVMEASLVLVKGPLKQTIRTRNRLLPSHAIQMQLIEGPLAHFEAEWQLKKVGKLTNVVFEATFRFNAGWLNRWFEQVMTQLCQSLLMQFQQRAKAIYGQ